MNEGTNSKDQILAMLKDDFTRWERLLAGLSEAQLAAPRLPGGWSVKDVLAHVAAWQKRSTARVDAALHRQTPTFPGWPEGLDPEADEDLEQVNAWIYQTNRDRPWASVYQDWKTGFLRLIDLCAAVPADDLLQAGKFSWLDGEPLALVPRASHGHLEEHYEALSAWLSEHASNRK